MKYRTAPARSSKMPTGLPYIVSNEAAERFSFYGMKGILAVFMAQYLHFMGSRMGSPMSEAAATEGVHLFNTAVYLTPLLGAFLSDAFLGKFRTIILLSLVYCAGHAALAFMGTAGDPGWWLISGLALIALGAGGIKPCVSAHVGDQFGKTNAHLLPRAFNYFYFSINLGAFISGLLTPWLLEWYGPHWAFGVPGVLMALATLAFWMGRHTFVHVPARGLTFFKEQFFSRSGLRALGKLSVIYVFVAVFWALFDQTGSSWVFQAENMDREWLGVTWLSSQIQAMNAVCILLFIPLFTFVIYPAIDRVFTLTPLRKIAIGLFVMVVGFGMVAVVQGWIDDGEKVSVAWQIFAIAIVTMAEVMVSIVSLEFSYSQAPNAMKSMVMAFYLCSVAAGNLLAAGVNAFIQVKDPLREFVLIDKAKKDAGDAVRVDGLVATFAGYDEELGTGDDLRLLYTSTGERRAVDFHGRLPLELAASRIEEAAREGGGGKTVLPSDEEGQSLLAGISDPWGNAVTYKLVSWKHFRVSSPGPDGKPKTPWDIGFAVAVLDPQEEGEKGKSWLQRHMEKQGFTEVGEGELDRDFKTVHPAEDGFRRTPFTGGQVTLEGASYFWFFTRLMLGSAVVFAFVTLFYKPRTYLQDEGPDSPMAEAEEDLGARGIIG